ncbi:MAG: hypothetical protein J1F66_02320 [Clostridiales bacterium]|nr:hypothetical protein [Clostridiales bacterium]
MKKAKMAVALLIVFLMVFTVVLSACEKHTHEFSTEWTSNDTYHWHKAICDEHPNDTIDQAAHIWDGDVCSVCGRDRSLNDYRLYITADLTTAKTAIGSVNSTIDAEVTAAYNAGVEAIEQANSVSAIQSAFSAAKTAMANCIPYANGIFDYTGLSTAEKTKILGILESYAIRTGLTGITLFEDGGYVMYNNRVTLGTETYIPGYGFGTLAEGSINAPLANETNEDWKLYWHGISASNPGTANYLNDKGSEVSDFYSYIAGAYYTNFMNSTKDGYTWEPELAMADPEPVGGLNAAGQSATWRFEVRQGLLYNTLGKRTEFNNRPVALEDFETAFKYLLNGANGLARGEEMTTATGASKIVGAKEYWNLTKNGNFGINNTVDFEDTVGIKVYKTDEGTENEKWWFEYTLGAPVNAFYARYYIDSSLYMPVPEDFINACGFSKDGDSYYLGFNGTKTYTPVDNSLSLGAYTLESWTNQDIVYKKNPNYVFADSKFAIEGVHIHIFEAAQNSSTASFEYFLNGNTDSAGIPYTLLDQYKNDPRTRTTTGSSCFKLNVNALDAATWEQLFGVNGTVAQTPRNEYWEVEPALNNSHFRQALSYALNRGDFADSRGSIASVDFLSSNYMSDPENGIAYDTTQEHKDAIATLVNKGTDDYGFSLELAREYFRIALQELEASGAYTPGTKDNPRVINLQIAWMYAVHESAYHDVVKQYWEDAFNDDSVTGGLYKLNVEFWVGTQWSDVYYNKMMVGQFDIGFGSISGNTLDPLSFFEVLSANQAISGNFTLNWGVDTNSPDADILVYNGMRWSFDALLEATQQPTQVINGAQLSLVSQGSGKFEYNPESGNVTATLSYAQESTAVIEDHDFVIYGYVLNEEQTGVEYAQWSIKQYEGTPTVANGVTTYTFDIPASEIAKFYLVYGVDLYLSYSVPSADIEASPMNPDSEEGYIGGWDLVLAAADDSEFKVDKDGNVVATVTVALLDGLTPDELDFYLWGIYQANNSRGYAYGYTSILDCIDGDVVENENGTLTYKFVIDADEFDGLLDAPWIEVYVYLGKGNDTEMIDTLESWDVVLAQAGRSSFAVDQEKGTVTATLTVALADGLTKNDIALYFNGYFGIDEAPHYAYREFDATELITNVKENANGTLTLTVVADLDVLDGLLELPGIDLYVLLGGGDAVAYADSWDVALVELVGASVSESDDEEDEEGTLIVSVTLDLAEGLSKDDLALALVGYDAELADVFELIDAEIEVVQNKNGTVTLVFKLSEELYGQLNGDFVITGEDEGVELSESQGIDIYLLLGDSLIYVDTWAHVFVQAD